jgi:hypothetical protein
MPALAAQIWEYPESEGNDKKETFEVERVRRTVKSFGDLRPHKVAADAATEKKVENPIKSIWDIVRSSVSPLGNQSARPPAPPGDQRIAPTETVLFKPAKRDGYMR